MNKVFVWVKEPLKAPRHVWISSSPENLKKYFRNMERCRIGSDAYLLCEKEGEFTDLHYNCTIFNKQFFGNVMLVGRDSQDRIMSWALSNADSIRYFSPLWEVKNEQNNPC